MKHESRTQQEAFRIERAKRNLSVRDVAEKVGISATLVGLYEHDGKTRLSRRAGCFDAICQLYGLNPDEVAKLVEKQRAEERKAKE